MLSGDMKEVQKEIRSRWRSIGRGPAITVQERMALNSEDASPRQINRLNTMV